MSIQDRIADMNTIVGFLVPVYSEDPLPGREVVHALTPGDMEKVRQGYACPRCLADFGGLYRPKCPVCQHERDIERDFAPTPEMWVAHRDERDRLAHENTRTRVPSMDEAIDRIMRDPDVEHGSLKSLMPSKWGRGR